MFSSRADIPFLRLTDLGFAQRHNRYREFTVWIQSDWGASPGYVVAWSWHQNGKSKRHRRVYCPNEAQMKKYVGRLLNRRHKQGFFLLERKGEFPELPMISLFLPAEAPARQLRLFE